MVSPVHRLGVLCTVLMVACADGQGPSSTMPIQGELGDTFRDFEAGDWIVSVPANWKDQPESGLPYQVHRFFGPFGEELLVLWGADQPTVAEEIPEGVGSIRGPLNQVTISPAIESAGPAGFNQTAFTLVGTDPAKSESPVAQTVAVLRKADEPFLALILEVPGDQPPMRQLEELTAMLEHR